MHKLREGLCYCMRKDNYQVSVLIFLTDAFTLSGTTWGLNVQCVVTLATQ